MSASSAASNADVDEAAGHGLHIVVNANAKRGGRRIAVQIARALPGASVRLTRSIEEVEGWLRTLLATQEPRCILSAGGDGSAVALLNALDRVVPKGEPFPPVGALPLGTGNAWAHALGARKLDTCIRALQRHEGAVPTKRYGLFDVRRRAHVLRRLRMGRADPRRLPAAARGLAVEPYREERVGLPHRDADFARCRSRSSTDART